MRRKVIWRGLLAGALPLSLAPATAIIAADYLSVEDAQRAAFAQAGRFVPVALALTAEQRRRIDELAGPQPRRGNLRIWKVEQDGAAAAWFFVDEVIGRQDLITYAVGIGADGNLTPIEVLSYRESHGGEIRNRAWRSQFARRADLGALRFRADIKNIAGATLSSEHVTEGVRWIIALWQSVLNVPAP